MEVQNKLDFFNIMCHRMTFDNKFVKKSDYP